MRNSQGCFSRDARNSAPPESGDGRKRRSESPTFYGCAAGSIEPAIILCACAAVLMIVVVVCAMVKH